MEKKYDIIIIGGGPAGLTAGLYATRAGLEVLLFERMVIGGQAALANEVENYPGFARISGAELCSNIAEQATNNGMTTVYDEVVGIDVTEPIKRVSTRDNAYECKVVIIATGSTYKKLGIEDDYIGRGVSYCATCDGNFFKGKTVAVVGGGNVAVADALYLSNIVHQVYLIHRRDTFRATSAELDKLESARNINIMLGSKVVALHGQSVLQSVDVETLGVTSTIDVDGMFVAVGQVPLSSYIKGKVETTDNGYIKVDANMNTTVQGVYAVGDVTDKFLRQIVTACNDGAIAAEQAGLYIKHKFNEIK